MIYYFLLAASIVLAVCKSSLYNSYAKKSNPTLGATFCFNAISYGVAALIALIGMLVSAEGISLTTVLCAFFYATIVISLIASFMQMNINREKMVLSAKEKGLSLSLINGDRKSVV